MIIFIEQNVCETKTSNFRNLSGSHNNNNLFNSIYSLKVVLQREKKVFSKKEFLIQS